MASILTETATEAGTVIGQDLVPLMIPTI